MRLIGKVASCDLSLADRHNHLLAPESRRRSSRQVRTNQKVRSHILCGSRVDAHLPLTIHDGIPKCQESQAQKKRRMLLRWYANGQFFFASRCRFGCRTSITSWSTPALVHVVPQRIPRRLGRCSISWRPWSRISYSFRRCTGIITTNATSSRGQHRTIVFSWHATTSVVVAFQRPVRLLPGTFHCLDHSRFSPSWRKVVRHH